MYINILTYLTTLYNYIGTATFLFQINIKINAFICH